MNKTISFIIMLMAMTFLVYTPILAGEKNKERVYKDNQYWQFRSDPDPTKSGWRVNPNYGSTYTERGYGGSNYNKNHKGGKRK